MHATKRTERVLASIRKNNREEIRVTRGEYKGHDVVNVRVWFQDRDSGEMLPGRDGVAFRAALVDDLVAALQSAKDDGVR